MPFIPSKTHQPTGLSFPKCAFGKQQGAFLLPWNKQYPWLHYQEGNDTVFVVAINAY